MSSEKTQGFVPSDIEQKWQAHWKNDGTFTTDESKDGEHYYVLEMFPYPSGKIHMGHLRNYAIGDVIARFKALQGYNVLHPMGWDAFGLPAENATIAYNQRPENKDKPLNPAVWTEGNIADMRVQLNSIGLSYDWEREIATCTPEYYRHEQKMFLDFLEAGIAYRKEAMVNWDPVDQTVLANEQVIDGCGWRSGAPVERKTLNQWFLKITDFAEDLLQGLDTLTNWPARVTLMQEKWIGKSYGAKVFFDIIDRDEKLEVFTTRPDTLFGASFCAISANHPLANELKGSNVDLAAFVEECNAIGVSAEAIEKAEKKGFDTGLRIKHPVIEGQELPLYIANFVLMEYGTGAIFACPAHDQRDLDFARKYDLPVIPVVSPDGSADFTVENEAYTGEGTLINSDYLNGMAIEDAKKLVVEKLQAQGAEMTISYRLRDWGVSRQRYWGCPIPIIYCNDCGAVPVPEAQLPVELPMDVVLDGTQQGNPLDHHPTWKHVDCPTCAKKAVRETDTFDTFFESSWYFARFTSPQETNKGFDKEAANRWLPVDKYIGGIEHAVLHLLYARFFTRALKKCGYLDVEEPFKGLMTQGMVCHETYKSHDGKWLYPSELTKADDGYSYDGQPVTVGPSIKMSKSKNNVVDPAGIIESYGADTARLFMLSDSPPERDLEWSDSGIAGTRKYLDRLWKLSQKESECAFKVDRGLLENVEGILLDIRKMCHKTIAAVTDDLEKFHLNKAVARVRELTNALEKMSLDSDAARSVFHEAFDYVLCLLNPMIPHLTEELNALRGHDVTLVNRTWPTPLAHLLVDDSVTIAVQVNGKLKATIECAKDCDKADAEKLALAQEGVIAAISGKEIRKIIVVPNRIVNVVAS